MFLGATAKPIDRKLINLAEEITAQNSHLWVLAAHEFRYSLHQTPVEIYIQEPREFNVLEEFIIRAGIDFSPPPTEDELASILGLDPIFVHSTAANLLELQTLSATSPITVTNQGRAFYSQGAVPQPAYPVQIYAISDALDGKLIFSTEPWDDVCLSLPDLADWIKIARKINDIPALSIEKIQKCIQLSGLDFHAPELCRIVTKCKVLSPAQIIWKSIFLFVIYDAVEQKLRIQIRSGKQILVSASNRMEVLQAKGKIPWEALCQLPSKALKEREASLNYKNAQIESRLAKITPTALKLGDAEVTRTFEEILNSAQRQIIMYSPCLGEDMINQEFLTLLQRLIDDGVRVLIGYGISPADVLEKLRSIKTLQGLSSVQVLCLADSHVKEVIVDQEIYLWGFYDWVSCGGEYLPHGESVYKVTAPQQVEEAYQFMVDRCQNHAQSQWDIALENRDLQLAVESLCVWVSLGMENLALREIEKGDWWELMPVWLSIILPNLDSKNLLNDSLGLALSLLSRVSGEETFMESLQQGWRKTIKAIASAHPETALNLLSNQVWADFVRLNIAQEDDSPHKLILPENLPLQKKQSVSHSGVKSQKSRK